MANNKDQIQAVEYFTLTLEDRPGQASTLQSGLARENVDLVGMLAFPIENRRTQVDLVPQHPDDLTKAAKKLNFTLQGPKTAFLIQGPDRTGAMGDVFDRLGKANINIHSTLGVSCGGNRYGALLWVAQSDVPAATRTLGATTMATHHV